MHFFKLTSILLVLAILQGCAAAVVAGAAGAASAANDRRTIGAQLDDNSIEVKAELAITQSDALSKNAHLNIISFNGLVLIVGQVPNDYLKDLAAKTVAEIPGVKRVHNQIRIGSNTSMLTRTSDVWITSKVKASLLTDDTVEGHKIKVITENGEVFLMGLIKANEADIAVEIVRNISGVEQVTKVFEYL